MKRRAEQRDGAESGAEGGARRGEPGGVEQRAEQIAEPGGWSREGGAEGGSRPTGGGAAVRPEGGPELPEPLQRGGGPHALVLQHRHRALRPLGICHPGDHWDDLRLESAAPLGPVGPEGGGGRRSEDLEPPGEAGGGAAGAVVGVLV